MKQLYLCLLLLCTTISPTHAYDIPEGIKYLQSIYKSDLKKENGYYAVRTSYGCAAYSRYGAPLVPWQRPSETRYNGVSKSMSTITEKRPSISLDLTHNEFKVRVYETRYNLSMKRLGEWTHSGGTFPYEPDLTLEEYYCRLKKKLKSNTTPDGLVYYVTRGEAYDGVVFDENGKVLFRPKHSYGVLHQEKNGLLWFECDDEVLCANGTKISVDNAKPVYVSDGQYQWFEFKREKKVNGMKYVYYSLDGQNQFATKKSIGTTLPSDYRNHLFAIGASDLFQNSSPNNLASKSIPTAGQPIEEKGPARFPSLEIATGSLVFSDPTGLNAINANGSYSIDFKVVNTGTETAYNCLPRVTLSGAKNGIRTIVNAIQAIEPGDTANINIPLISSKNTTDGALQIGLMVEEPNGFGTEQMQMSVATHSFEEPLIVINDFTVTSDVGSTLQRKKPFQLQLLLQNIKHGTAEDVHVNVSLPPNIFIVDGSEQTSFEKVDGGQSRSIVLSLVASNNYTASDIPLSVTVSEKYGQYSQNRNITLSIDQPLSLTKIDVKEQAQLPKQEIALARIGSDVDREIPKTNRKSENTFALIITNEEYKNVSKVPYANNDGAIFATYCSETLGIDKKNIRHINNATLNEMRIGIRWLQQIGEAFGPEARLIIYYSGHGIPDESDRSAYLLPIDGTHSDMNANYKLDDLYAAIGSLNIKSATLFLDACFSGAAKGDNMLVAARGVAIKAKSAAPVGRMVVLAAAQADETAYPYDEGQHGLFTYYLLKKLKENNGDITLGTLSDYISEHVLKTALVNSGKPQTPATLVSPLLKDSWRQTKL